MRKKGFSLIVLIVTIIVVIIIAAAVILTLSKNNPIESAKEARFKEDVRTFQDELALTVSKEYATAGGHRDTKITTSDFDEIKEYIPSFSEKYRDKFVIKNDELVYTKNLDEKEKEYAQSLNFKKYSILPSEYQQVEYIESTGNQFLDTGLIFNDKYQIEVKYKFSAFPSLQTWLTGAWYGNCGILIGFFNGKFYCYAGNETKSGIQYSINADTNIHYVKIKKEGVFFDNNLVANTNFDEIPNTNDTIKIFKRLIAGEDYDSIRRIYEIKYYNMDNVITRNFIPCKSKTIVTNVVGMQVPSNTMGMYDLVEGKFYTNQGTGEFIAGPEVNE